MIKMKTKRHITLLIALLLTGMPSLAQVAALEDLANDRGYLIRQNPADDDNQRILCATGNNTQVGTATSTTDTDLERWAIYTSDQTGYRYVYDLGAKKFLTNTTAGCSLSDAASPTHFIGTSQTGSWLLMNQNMLTGAQAENNQVIFSKSETLSTADITFSVTETTRTLTAEELAEIKAKVDAAEKGTRDALLAEIAQLLEKAKSTEALGHSDFAGHYDYADLQAAYASPDRYSNEELRELMSLTRASVYPKAGRYYRILNSTRPQAGVLTNVLTLTTEKQLGARSLDHCQPGIRHDEVLETLGLFQFVPSTAGNHAYLLYNPSAEMYAGASTSGNFIPLKGYKSDAAPYTLLDEDGLLFRFQNSLNPNLYLTANGESNLVSYNQLENPELWYFQEVKSVSLAIGSSGYATTCLPCAIELPEEVDAYVGVSQDNQTLHLKKVESYTGSKVLPAYLPVILKRQDGCTTSSFECPIVYESPSADIPNLLRGVTLRSQIEEGSYILYQGTDKALGFYLVDPSDRELNGNKAYLPKSALYPGQSFVISFDGQITGITPPEATTDKPEVLYDLSGKKVTRPQKGLYITNKGKKLMIHK